MFVLVDNYFRPRIKLYFQFLFFSRKVILDMRSRLAYLVWITKLTMPFGYSFFNFHEIMQIDQLPIKQTIISQQIPVCQIQIVPEILIYVSSELIGGVEEAFAGI